MVVDPPESEPPSLASPHVEPSVLEGVRSMDGAPTLPSGYYGCFWLATSHRCGDEPCTLGWMRSCPTKQSQRRDQSTSSHPVRPSLTFHNRSTSSSRLARTACLRAQRELGETPGAEVGRRFDHRLHRKRTVVSAPRSALMLNGRNIRLPSPAPKECRWRSCDQLDGPASHHMAHDERGSDEELVGELALAIGLPCLLAPSSGPPPHPAHVTRHARDGCDPRSRVREERMEQACQGEMSQMVDPELLLESLSGPSEWRDHDPSVEDEPIESVMCSDDVTGGVSDRSRSPRRGVGARRYPWGPPLEDAGWPPRPSLHLGHRAGLRTAWTNHRAASNPMPVLAPCEDAPSCGGGRSPHPASHAGLLMVMGINPRSITEQRFVDGFGEIA